jgi:tetratricopeptide (TPR) repeat protein
MSWRRIGGRSAILLLLAVGASAQSRVGSGSSLLTGRFLTPTSFADSFEVQLFQLSHRPVAHALVRPNEPFTFSGLVPGVYFIVADVPGFKTVRQRVDVIGNQRDASVTIFLEVAHAVVVREPLNLSGEEDAVVNLADLARYEPHLVEALETSNEELLDGEFEKARQRLESIVREAPDFYAARKALGATYQKLQRFRDAEVEYMQARDLRPASAAPLTSLGSLYLEVAESIQVEGPSLVRGILNAAMGSLLRAIDLNPDAAFAHYLLGVTYSRAALYEDAEERLLRALELEDRLSAARLMLAEVYIQIQEWPNALTQLQVYLDENPDASNVTQVRHVRSRIEAALNAEEKASRTDGSADNALADDNNPP